MNQLTKYLVDGILNEGDESLDTVALFGGGFKPPTKGHLEVVLQGLKENPQVKQVQILVGSGERNGITQKEAVKIWEMYKKLIPISTQIVKVQSPFSYIKTYLQDHQNEDVYVFIGARAGNEEDDKDVAERSAYAKKYSEKAIPTKIQTSSGVSGTMARKAALSGNNKEFLQYFPNQLTDSEKEEIIQMVSSVINELKLPINENASYSKEIDIQARIMQLTQHMLDKGYNIEPLPKVEFVDGDSENARDFLGKTAYYNPNNQLIVLYTEGRHPKDIVRSFAHEMIHHIQNLEGRLGAITTTNTQEDDHLNDIEAEANLKGTMTFRNWTDSLNENTGDSNPLKLPYIDTWHDGQYKVKDGKIEAGIKLMTQAAKEAEKLAKEEQDGGIAGEAGYYRGTIAWLEKDYNTVKKYINDKFVKSTGNHEVLNRLLKSKDKTYKEAYSINEAIVGDKIECDNCNWSWNIVDGGDDLFICHKCWHDNTPITEKKSKDPFGLNQYARELAQGLEESLNEGRYDTLANKLSSIAFESFKDIHDRGDKEGSFEFRVDHPDDEHDIPSEEFYFDFVGKVEITDDEYEVDGGANAGFDNKGNEITPLLSVKFKIPQNPTKNPSWEDISFDIKDVVRHELEHLTQDGENEKGGAWHEDPKLRRPSKYMEDDQMLRDLIDLDLLPKADYFRLEKEVDAMLQGLYFKAKKSKRPFKDVVNTYLDIFTGQETITQEEKENILDIWRSRAKALSLPVFENKVMENKYKIYLDMDGVIVDFDKRFTELAGMGPREYESSFGKEKFWDFIDSKEKGGGVGFWVGMDWMPGGEALYNRVAQHNHALLSSPSRSESSRIGKHQWKKKYTPSTKLILALAKNKQNYADGNNILIDDRESNISQWRKAGGIGILYKSANQVNKELDKLGL